MGTVFRVVGADFDPSGRSALLWSQFGYCGMFIVVQFVAVVGCVSA